MTRLGQLSGPVSVARCVYIFAARCFLSVAVYSVSISSSVAVKVFVCFDGGHRYRRLNSQVFERVVLIKTFPDHFTNKLRPKCFCAAALFSH